MANWYLVHTKPSRERQVAVHLYQRGFVVYLPLIWASPVNGHDERGRPHFPGYLFAKLDLGSAGPNVIRWSPGVRELVEFCGEPVLISDAFVAELREWLNRVRALNGITPDGTEFFQVPPGPFEGFEGMFSTRLLGADRACILLACIQQEFWRQNSPAQPPAETPDDSVTPPTESISVISETKEDGPTLTP
jgi:transcriptional antiterminator RfaH